MSNRQLTIDLDNITTDELIDTINTIKNEAYQVKEERIVFQSVTLRELEKLRGAAHLQKEIIEGHMRTGTMEDANIAMARAEAIAETYDYLISTNNSNYRTESNGE